MNDDAPRTEDNGGLAAPARFTRETLLGCLGLFCVLLTLPLLWLAVGAGPGWQAHVLPLLAFIAAIGGAALTLRAPGSFVSRSTDPRRPLTHAGASPAIERPAALTNRLAWTLAAALCACAISGYAWEVAHSGTPWGLALMLLAGLLLLAQGMLTGMRRFPSPALRWLRLSIYGEMGRQSAPLIAIGFVTMGCALFLALLDGYLWGALGLALVVAVAVMAAPLARRMPRRYQSPRAVNERANQSE